MPFYIPKITNIIMIQNMMWILFFILSGISIITDSSIYQWIIFPADFGYNLICCCYYNNKLRKHYKDQLRIYVVKQVMVLSCVLLCGLVIFYNIHVIKVEHYSSIVVALHNTTFFIQFFIYVLGVRVTNDMTLLRKIVEYYKNDDNFNNVNTINDTEDNSYIHNTNFNKNLKAVNELYSDEEKNINLEVK